MTGPTLTQDFTYNDRVSRASNYCLGPAGGGCYATDHSQWLHSCSVPGLSIAAPGFTPGAPGSQPRNDTPYFSLNYFAPAAVPSGSGTLQCAYYINGSVSNQRTLYGPTVTVRDTTPVIDTMAPTAITQSATPVAVTFTGAGFGTAPPTLLITPNLSYTISAGNKPNIFAAQITAAAVGTYSVILRTPAGDSAARTLAVYDASPQIDLIQQLSPLYPGGQAYVVIYGRNF